MTIYVAIEGDRGTPIREMKIVENDNLESKRDFLKEWAREYYESLLDEDNAEELDEIARGWQNDGDKWWFEETWCFQKWDNPEYLKPSK